MGEDEAERVWRLDGARALVTGGTRGTGYEIARELHAAGAGVILTGRDADAAGRAARSIGEGVTGLSYDAARDGVAEALAAAVAARWDRLDILVNNAATLTPHFLTRISPAEFDSVFRVNLRAPLFLTLALKPLLAASGKASVINIAAAGAHRPIGGLGAYTASKAALINLSGTMAKEWAADGIRVNTVCPGMVRTPLTEAVYQDATTLQQRLALVPLGRIGQAEDVGAAVAYLSSAAASYVTGQNLLVDGGISDHMLAMVPGRPGQPPVGSRGP